MTRVPRNRYTQAELLRSGRQKAIIVGGVPIPAGFDLRPVVQTRAELDRLFAAEVRDEIASQPELVRTLKRTSGRTTFFENIRLPHRRAVCLEDFEAGLRSAGLMGVDEELVQSTTSPGKFRVQKVRVRENGHSGSYSAFSGHGYDMRSPALTNCAVGRPRVKGAPVSGEPSLPLKLTRPKLVRKKGA